MGRALDNSNAELTSQLNARGGPKEAAAVDEVYTALKGVVGSVLARDRQAGGRAAWSMQATSVVHECWATLGTQGGWESRAHFFGAVSRRVRQMIVDEARRRAVRDGHAGKVSRLRASRGVEAGAQPELLDLEAALQELAKAEPRASRVLSYHLFGDLEKHLIAEIEGVSVRTVERELRFAQAWVRVRLSGSKPVSDRSGTGAAKEP